MSTKIIEPHKDIAVLSASINRVFDDRIKTLTDYMIKGDLTGVEYNGRMEELQGIRRAINIHIYNAVTPRYEIQIHNTEVML